MVTTDDYDDGDDDDSVDDDDIRGQGPGCSWPLPLPGNASCSTAHDQLGHSCSD